MTVVPALRGTGLLNSSLNLLNSCTVLTSVTVLVVDDRMVAGVDGANEIVPLSMIPVASEFNVDT